MITRSSILFASESDKGQVRSANEDACGYVRIGRKRLFVTADGMGGELGGGRASEIAVQAICNAFRRRSNDDPRKVLLSAFAEANTEILQLQETVNELKGMGTTAVALVIDGNRFVHAHIGDSRLYLVRGSNVVQLTEDHTLVSQMVRGGLLTDEDARTHPNRHILNRVLGREQSVQVEVSERPMALAAGDFLVLCTDGVTDVVDDAEIGALVRKNGPGRGCEGIIELANQRGGNDNATVQVVYRGKPSPSWNLGRTHINVVYASGVSTFLKSGRSLGVVGALMLTAALASWLIARYIVSPPELTPRKRTEQVAAKLDGIGKKRDVPGVGMSDSSHYERVDAQRRAEFELMAEMGTKLPALSTQAYVDHERGGGDNAAPPTGVNRTNGTINVDQDSMTSRGASTSGSAGETEALHFTPTNVEDSQGELNVDAGLTESGSLEGTTAQTPIPGFAKVEDSQRRLSQCDGSTLDASLPEVGDDQLSRQGAPFASTVTPNVADSGQQQTSQVRDSAQQLDHARRVCYSQVYQPSCLELCEALLEHPGLSHEVRIELEKLRDIAEMRRWSAGRREP